MLTYSAFRVMQLWMKNSEGVKRDDCLASGNCMIYVMPKLGDAGDATSKRLRVQLLFVSCRNRRKINVGRCIGVVGGNINLQRSHIPDIPAIFPDGAVTGKFS
jgi:hypothetical protein